MLVSTPTIDLVLATMGRTDELGRFLESAAAQTYRRFRIIIVDQNEDDRLDAVLGPFSGLEIRRLRAKPGLSRARNVGLAEATGDVIAFPDDDCWYPSELLERVVAALGGNPAWAGISVCTRDARGELSCMLWDRSAGPVGRYTIWRRAISIGMFLRSSAVTAAGGFAENLGQGSGTRWGSGEESDFLLRVLQTGQEVHYEPSLYVHHESPRPTFSHAESRRSYSYGLGHGRVLRIHGYPAWFVAFRVAQLLAGSAFFVLTARPARARYYFAMARGRAAGWIKSESSGVRDCHVPGGASHEGESGGEAQQT